MDCFIGTILPWAPTFAPNDFLLCWGESITVNQYQALYSLISTLYGGDSANFKVPDLRGRTMVGTGQNTLISPTVYQQGAVAGATANILSIANMPTHTHPAIFQPTIGTQSVNLPAVPGTPSTPPSITAATLQANPSNTGASNIVSATNSVLASSPAGNAGTTMWVSSQGATPVNVGGLTVTLNPGTQGTPTIPAQSVSINTVTGGSVTNGLTGSSAPINNMSPYLVLNFIIAVNGIYPMRP